MILLTTGLEENDECYFFDKVEILMFAIKWLFHGINNGMYWLGNK